MRESAGPTHSPGEMPAAAGGFSSYSRRRLDLESRLWMTIRAEGIM